MSSPTKVSVFYDGGCRVCSFEIESYRKKDLHGNITFIDIDSPDFQASTYGLDPAHVRRVLHVKTSDGRVIQGVPAFAEIWRALDRPALRAIADLSERPMIRPVLELGYQLFIRIRPWLPRKNRMASCENSRCSLDQEA